MNIEDYATYREIIHQPQALAAALRAVREQVQPLRTLWQTQVYQQVLFTGCGSTYYLSLAAASVFQHLTGISARGVPAGELLVTPQDFVLSGAVLLIAVSRSGTTTETLRSVHAFREVRGGSVITITCQPDNKLSTLGDVNILIPEAQEQSIAQTQAFSAMWLASCALSAVLSQRQDLLDELEKVPELSHRIIETAQEKIQSLGGTNTVDRIYFLGSGLRYGLACEGSLKMKEMSLTHSEPFHFLEFRHGPKSMVTASTLIVALLGDDHQQYEMNVLRDLRAIGARVLVLGNRPVGVLDILTFAFDSTLSEIGYSTLYLPPLQLLALGRALAKGHNPDQPRNLEAVVYLDQPNNA